MYSILSNAEGTEHRVIWHRNRKQIVVAIYATREQAIQRAWPKY
jgi:hypothetical protein